MRASRPATPIVRAVTAAVVLAVLGALVGLVASLLATPVYRASASLAFSPAGARTSTDVNQGAMYIQTEMPTFAQLASSQDVLMPVIRGLGLDTTPTRLAAAIDTTIPDSTAVLTVRVSQTSPARAARIADAVADELSSTVSASAPRLAGTTAPVVSVRTIARATVPDAPSSPRTTLNTVAGGVVGLLVGILLAAAYDQLARTGRLDPSRGGRTRADEVEAGAGTVGARSAAGPSGTTDASGLTPIPEPTAPSADGPPAQRSPDDHEGPFRAPTPYRDARLRDRGAAATGGGAAGGDDLPGTSR